MELIDAVRTRAVAGLADWPVSELLPSHRAMSEGIVNHLMNHQGIRHACWKGLALARSQVGLAVLLLNPLKWYKIRHGQLQHDGAEVGRMI